jgi:hypothetical protein
MALAVGACGSSSSPPTTPVAATPAPAAVSSVPLPATPDQTALLDAAFRIDVQRVEAVFDLVPAEGEVRVWSATTFRMRPGQSRPIVHFAPAVSGTDVTLALDGTVLETRSESDVRLLRFETSGQDSVEIQRDLSGGTTPSDASSPT